MLNPRWRKVVRDLWDNKARTTLVALAIAVGVLAFGSVFIARDVMVADLNVQWRSISPSSINMYVSSFDEDVVRSVAGMRHVAAVEGRARYPVKLITPNRSYTLILYAVRDYENMRVDRIFPEEGSWPPSRREILFERTNVPFLNAAMGDTVTVELPDGSLRELTFGGIIHDYDAPPATMIPQLTGYVSLQTLRWLGHPGTYNRLDIATDETLTDMAAIDLVAEQISDRLQADGYWTSNIYTEDPNEHFIVETLTAIMAVFGMVGFFSLGLSGFLVVNTISAVLTQQKRQIGMMKAVGARGYQVAGIYLVMVAAFGVLALFIALPVGAALGYGLVRLIANYGNFDILDFHIPLWVLVVEVLAALVAPMAAAMIPILSGMRTTVREAVSDYGIKPKSKRGLVDRLLGSIRGLPRPTLLSLRNTFRRKGRLWLTLGTLALAGSIFIAVVNARSSLMAELKLILQLFQFDLQVVLDDAYPVRQLGREALSIPGVVHAEGWALAWVTRIRPDGTEGTSFNLYGVPTDTPLIDPPMLEGRWLQPDDQNAIVLGSTITRDEPDIQVGDEIVLPIGDIRRRWQVVGIVSAFGQNYLSYANYDYLSRIQNAAGRSFVVLAITDQHDGAYQAQVMGELEDRLQSVGISVTYSNTMDEVIRANVAQVDVLVGVLLFLSTLVAVVGGLGLGGTMGLNVLERTREIGVMRAIGASHRSVRSMVVTEGILIGVMSWALASVLCIPITLGLNAIVGNVMIARNMMFTYSPVGLLVWLLIVVVLSTIASLAPARRAATISVREALAYE